jgi:hypothetical protein
MKETIDSNKYYIQNSDLRKKLYPIEDLIKNVQNLEISTLLRWQKLDVDFCKKYILNEEYQSVEDSYLVTIDYILKRQPHLKYEDLLE